MMEKKASLIVNTETRIAASSEAKKLKIAVLLFGHLRTYDLCAPFLRKNVLKKYDYNLFIHTWSALDHNTKTWHNHNVKGLTDKTQIEKAYGEITALKIEEQIPEDWGMLNITAPYVKSQISLFGIHSLFHSMREVNSLCESYAKNNNKHYDIVLCTRPDIMLKSSFFIEEILAVLDEQDIEKAFFTFGLDSLHKCHSFAFMRATDIFFFARPHVISAAINNTQHIINEFKRHNSFGYPPEYAFVRSVIRQGMTPYQLCLPLDIQRRKNVLKQDGKIYYSFIRIKIREKFLRVYVLQLIKRQIVRLRFFLGNFEIDFCIGKENTDAT